MSIEHLDEANISDYLDTHHLNTDQWTLIIWTLIIWTPIIWTYLNNDRLNTDRSKNEDVNDVVGWLGAVIWSSNIWTRPMTYNTSVNELWSSRTNWIVSGKFSCHLATTLSLYKLNRFDCMQSVWQGKVAPPPVNLGWLNSLGTRIDLTSDPPLNLSKFCLQLDRFWLGN